MDEYRQVLHTVAENPGLPLDEIQDVAPDGVDDVRGHIEHAVDQDDIIVMNEKHWIVRKGEFGFHEYDHPI